MATNRRQFLQLASSALLLGLSGCQRTSPGMLLGGFGTRAQTYGVAAIRTSGDTIWQRELPARLHEIAVQPERGWVAAVARRPGHFISLLALESGAPLGRIVAPGDHVFEGHALWQGTQLWATAAHIDTGAARLLRYDLNPGWRPGIKPTDILSLPGTGPHQILSLRNELVIAMGGWHERGRQIANADNFRSALVRLNLSSGVVHSLVSPQHDLSVRHLASDGQQIWAGLQYARPHPSQDALIYRTEGENWRGMWAPESGWEVFSGYIGSLAQVGGELIATSPQGHAYGRWSTGDGRCLQTASVLDVCAAAAGGDDWFIGSGTGSMRNAFDDWRETEFFWDNHWTYVAG